MYDNVTRAIATSSDHRAVRRAWPALPDTMPIPTQGGEHWCPTKQRKNTKNNIHKATRNNPKRLKAIRRHPKRPKADPNTQRDQYQPNVHLPRRGPYGRGPGGTASGAGCIAPTKLKCMNLHSKPIQSTPSYICYRMNVLRGWLIRTPRRNIR